MKNIILLIIFLFLAKEMESQIVRGNIVDENDVGLSGVELQLYINPNVYSTNTLTDGSFVFNIVTEVKDGQLPSGYAVSNNFPNPFNPKTRIEITLPNRANVKIEVFNMLGQSVKDVIERTFSMGTDFVDLDLNGLPNGFYIARITLAENYTIIKKMMLIYGSQHLTTNGGVSNPQLNKSNNNYNTNFNTIIDSLVATSTIIGRKTFYNLPPVTGDTLDLGNLTVERYCPGTPTVTYAGKTYNTVRIGNQCWFKENLDVGARINGIEDMTDNGIIEKYCYDDDPTNCETYGGLYQWDETMQYSTTPGVQGICPPGWHVPAFEEFDTLAATVNWDGNSLKAIGQGSGDGEGTNTSGFSALLAGVRHEDGYFYNLGYSANFWNSTEINATDAYFLTFISDDSQVYLIYYSKVYGYSVRCLKN